VPWRQFAKDHGIRDFGTARGIADLEIQTLLLLLRKNSDQRDRSPTKVFTHESPNSNLLTQIVYTGTLRNKYSHANYVESQEQLADLLLVKKVVTALRDLDPQIAAQAAPVVTLIESEVSRIVAAIESDDEARWASPARPSQDVDDMKTAVLELKDLIRELHSLRGGSTAPEQARELTDHLGMTVDQLRAVSHESEVAIREVRMMSEYNSQAVRSMEHLRAEMIQTSAEIAELRSELRNNARAQEKQPATTDDESAELDDHLMLLADQEMKDLEPIAVQAARRKYTPREVRDQLIQLRSQIWSTLGCGPAADGLLRKTMIDELITRQITSVDDFFSRIPSYLLDATDQSQFKFLPDVIEILQGLEPYN
jgi:hypothetical protein